MLPNGASSARSRASAGFPSEERYEICRHYFIGTNPSNDVVPPLYSILRGAKTRRLLRKALGDRRIEALPLRYFCVSCDLVAREAIVHRRGPVADAVYGSLAIPGVFPPVPTDDGRLPVTGRCRCRSRSSGCGSWTSSTPGRTTTTWRCRSRWPRT